MRLGLVFSGVWLLAAMGAAAEPMLSPGPASPAIEEMPVGEWSQARPAKRDVRVPRARWEHRRHGELWTLVALSAVTSHGRALLDVVLEDIAEWCPAYPENGETERAAFWTGLLSTLSRYESTWNPHAVGGNGRWYGLLQIAPPTAEFRNCRAQSGEALKHGPSNLNCAVRIMAVTVPRDNAISVKDTRWRGVAADWGPLRNDGMRRDMQRYTKRQTYCRLLSEVRPKPRP
jgi:hypothetical protein